MILSEHAQERCSLLSALHRYRREKLKNTTRIEKKSISITVVFCTRLMKHFQSFIIISVTKSNKQLYSPIRNDVKRPVSRAQGVEQNVHKQFF